MDKKFDFAAKDGPCLLVQAFLNRLEKIKDEKLKIQAKSKKSRPIPYFFFKTQYKFSHKRQKVPQTAKFAFYELGFEIWFWNTTDLLFRPCKLRSGPLGSRKGCRGCWERWRLGEGWAGKRWWWSQRCRKRASSPKGTPERYFHIRDFTVISFGSCLTKITWSLNFDFN